MILFALIFLAVMLFFTNAFFVSTSLGKPIERIYATDKSEHWYLSQDAEDYRTYKWFIDTFGWEINEKTAEKLRSLEYPRLEAVIAERSEFADMGVKNLSDLMELHEKYFSDTKPYLYLFSGSEEPDGLSEEERKEFHYNFDRTSVLSDIISGVDGYFDKYIGKSEILANAGIKSRADYSLMYIEAAYENYIPEMGFLQKPSDEAIFRGYSDELNRLKAEVITPAVESGNYDAETDAVREEYKRFEFVYLLLKYYDECKKDGFYLMDSRVWQRSSSHTYTEYFYGKVEFDGKNGSAAKHAEMRARVSDRLGGLGGSYFTVRTPDISSGLLFATKLFMEFAAGLAVFLVLPYSVSDKLSRVIPLQYSSKTGRKTLKIQVFTVLAASLFMTTLCNIGMFILTLNDLYAEFYSIPMSSFSAMELYWFDMNMWQYLGLNMLFNYLISAGFALISFFVGRLCGGYVSAFASELPLIIVVYALYQNPLQWLCALPESFWEDWLWLGGILLLSVAAAAVLLRRAKKAFV